MSVIGPDGRKKVECLKGTPVESVCTDAIVAEFAASISYVQLKKKEDYATLCSQWNAAKDGTVEDGRIFYLSIPPFAYEDTAAWINAHCMPAERKDGVKPFIRAAFEKPFGSDLASAKVQAAALKKSLPDEAIYRVDHYLGKSGVKQISDLRYHNHKELTKYWNTENIQAMEIVMMETEGCAGRTNFYDSYGVFRDIHQNHLTEVLALLLVEEAPDMDAFLASPTLQDMAGELQRKADAIGACHPVQAESARAFQYQGYADEVRVDSKNPEAQSRTATLGTAEIYSGSERFKDIPITITAGKQLSHRRAYVKVIFNHNAPLFKGANLKGQGVHGEEKRQIIFHIQGGIEDEANAGEFIKHGPFLAIGKDVYNALGGAVNLPADRWTKEEDAGKLPKWAGYMAWVNKGVPDRPYDKLLVEMYRGNAADFVGTKGLMNAWTLWDGLLNEYKNEEPTVYNKGIQVDNNHFGDDEAKLERGDMYLLHSMGWPPRMPPDLPPTSHQEL